MRRILLNVSNQDGTTERLLIKPSSIAFIKDYKAKNSVAKSFISIEQTSYRYFCLESADEIDALLNQENEIYLNHKEELRLKYIEASSQVLLQ